jgi:16S rRNA processing protein RimM
VVTPPAGLFEEIPGDDDAPREETASEADADGVDDAAEGDAPDEVSDSRED